MQIKQIHLAVMVLMLSVALIGAIAFAEAVTKPTASNAEPKSTAEPESATLPQVGRLMAGLLSSGEIQAGHANVSCRGCHDLAPGTTRQQMQAIAKALIQGQSVSTDFGFRAVSSDVCMDCHQRDQDRHPIYRFNEPRFQKVLQELPANNCLGCHGEHTGQRLRSTDITFCAHCHQDLALRNEVLDISHSTLIENEQWDTCLGCHDFHGNHIRTTQTRYADTFAAEQVRTYLADGTSPYGDSKRQRGANTR